MVTFPLAVGRYPPSTHPVAVTVRVPALVNAHENHAASFLMSAFLQTKNVSKVVMLFPTVMTTESKYCGMKKVMPIRTVFPVVSVMVESLEILVDDSRWR